MTETFGDQSIVDVRDDEFVADKVALLTGLPVMVARERISAAHGRTRLRKVFELEWPRSAESLGRMTVAFVREIGLQEEIKEILGVSSHLVTRRLNSAAGQTLIRNAFFNEWPETADESRKSRQFEGATSEDATTSAKAHAGATAYYSAGEIEAEDPSDEHITKPFDPNLIRVKLWTPTVDLVMKRLAANEIDLAPDFQRASGIWRDRAQSQLIESLLIRIPLPAFYFDGSNEDQLVVVDGIQRLTTLKRFLLDKDLVLNGLEYLAELENKNVNQLPRQLVRRIEETMLTVYLIERGTPEKAKLNIFKRLNTGGEPLTAQEIRHAMNPGVVRTYLKELTSMQSFLLATEEKFNDDRMTAQECVLRFCAFIQVPPSEYPNDGDLDSFLHSAMRAINEWSDGERDEVARRFDRSMTAAANVLGSAAFRKPKRHGPRSLVNKALFEAWAIGFDGCTDAQLDSLEKRKERVGAKFLETFEANRDFDQALSQGTGDPKKVRLRFDVIASILREVG